MPDIAPTYEQRFRSVDARAPLLEHIRVLSEGLDKAMSRIAALEDAARPARKTAA